MLQVGEMKCYDVQETAALLNSTAQTVRNYIKTGKIKAQKLGTRYYIAEENIQNFLRGKA